MRSFLLLFILMTVFVSSAQNSSVRLVGIQSSECGGMYYIEPHFMNNKQIGDTTYISLSCTNNCQEYNTPEVTVSGDSVLIVIRPGTRITRYQLANGKYIEKSELSPYPKDSILEEVSETMTLCECCFTFDLKVLGLDSSANYNYFYNGEFIDPDY